uniref:Uncharacterized protein n=1 Tax=Arion vulgaris TaxID=1028688 RepID=A0A0B7ACU2_9EUPU
MTCMCVHTHSVGAMEFVLCATLLAGDVDFYGEGRSHLEKPSAIKSIHHL